MNIPRKTTTAALLLIMLLLAVPCLAGTPMETIKTGVNKVMEILRDPTYEDNEEGWRRQRKDLRNTIETFFDRIEISRRTLGRHWNSLELEQKKEFVRLFSDLLDKTYLSHLRNYTNETVRFDSEIMLSDDKAEVKTFIVTDSKEIPLTYRLHTRKDQWLIYDVLVENSVSMVKNYREQFREILSSKSPEELIEVLREKTADMEK